MIQINNRKIGESFYPYIIAELSANHGGSIERAKQSILAAKKAGVDAVKIQSYTPDTMTIDCDKEDFQIKEGLWKGTSLYNLYREAFTPYEWHKELFEYAAKIELTLFSTPFDESAVDLLEALDTPAYKIASFELTDLPLIEYIAKRNKPILISTGMGSLDEIEEAITTIKSCGNDQILMFHCISSYPAPTDQSHLLNIKLLASKFKVEVGLSDHTISGIASAVSIGLGVVAIEKHFKLDNDDCGPDASFSLLPAQLKELVEDSKQAWLAVGSKKFARSQVEKSNTIFRRSLYFVKDLSKGEVVTESDIRRIRPGYGLPPKYFKEIVGKKLIKSVERGDSVQWDCF
jgi:N-acetylneuraminate synthase